MSSLKRKQSNLSTTYHSPKSIKLLSNPNIKMKDKPVSFKKYDFGDLYDDVALNYEDNFESSVKNGGYLSSSCSAILSPLGTVSSRSASVTSNIMTNSLGYNTIYKKIGNLVNYVKKKNRSDKNSDDEFEFEYGNAYQENLIKAINVYHSDTINTAKFATKIQYGNLDEDVAIAGELPLSHNGNINYIPNKYLQYDSDLERDLENLKTRRNYNDYNVCHSILIFKNVIRAMGRSNVSIKQLDRLYESVKTGDKTKIDYKLMRSVLFELRTFRVEFQKGQDPESYRGYESEIGQLIEGLEKFVVEDIRRCGNNSVKYDAGNIV